MAWQAVAAQAATALQNARLYKELQLKAAELVRLRQFSDSIIESLTEGVIVVNLQDHVVRCNRRMETLAGLSSDVLFDALAIRIDPTKAAGKSFTINWSFTDRDERLTTTLKHSTLTHRVGERSDKAQVSVATTRATFEIGRAHV